MNAPAVSANLKKHFCAASSLANTNQNSKGDDNVESMKRQYIFKTAWKRWIRRQWDPKWSLKKLQIADISDVLKEYELVFTGSVLVSHVPEAAVGLTNVLQLEQNAFEIWDFW